MKPPVPAVGDTPDANPALTDAGARGVALAVLLGPAVLAWQHFEAGRSLEDALERARGSGGSTPAHGAALRDIVSTAMRHRASAQWVRSQLVSRAPAPEVGALLDLALGLALAGTYPDHVLVDQTVRAAPRAGGLVNAVLRNFLRRRDELTAAAGADPARRGNVPVWWYRRLRQEFGAQAEAILAAQRSEPALVLRVNLRRATVDAVLGELAQAGIEARALGHEAVHLPRPRAADRIPGFAQGRVSVQDAGAQLAAHFLDARAGMRVLDACAAPGGKTAHLLERSDCEVEAVEVDAARAARIAPALVRLGLAGERVRVHVGDAGAPAHWWDGRAYERILLDAPCTGSGVVSRHPDIVWLRRSADVAKSATLQARLLDSLWPLLAPAGRLLYVVCSIFPEEGRQQVAAFLRRQPDARPVPLQSGGAPELLLLPGGGLAQAGPGSGSAQGGPAPLPEVHDGFFFALFEKT